MVWNLWFNLYEFSLIFKIFIFLKFNSFQLPTPCSLVGVEHFESCHPGVSIPCGDKYYVEFQLIKKTVLLSNWMFNFIVVDLESREEEEIFRSQLRLSLCSLIMVYSHAHKTLNIFLGQLGHFIFSFHEFTSLISGLNVWYFICYNSPIFLRIF